MLWKLLKYDVRSMWKQFSIIWPAALVLALVNRITLFYSFEQKDWSVEPGGILGGITLTAFVGVMFAMFILSMVYVLSRFYKGLLGDEGYLMHTLPVKTWQLVASKLICALLVTVVNVIVAGLAMVLIMPLNWSDLFDARLWNGIFRGLAQHPDMLLYLVEFCLMGLMALAFSVTKAYLAMGIGHLFSRRRVLMSVAAYLGINALIPVAMTAAGAVVNKIGLFPAVSQGLENHAAVWLMIVLLAVPTALFFAGTSYILKTRLNLE